MTMFTLTIENDEDDGSIWYVTSGDAVPGCRLFVAEQSLQMALLSVPKAISDLRRALAVDGVQA